MAGTWTVTYDDVSPTVANVTATYTDVADPTLSFSWNSTAKVSQANLDTFVADAKSKLATYLSRRAVLATRIAAITTALNAP